MKYNINITPNKKSLSQVRSNGLLMNVLRLDGDTFSNITDTFYCKDYLMDFLVEEKYGKSESVYGFKHTKTGILETSEYLYLGLSTNKYGNVSSAIKADNTKAFENVTAFLKVVDKVYSTLTNGEKVSEVLDTTDSDYKVIKFPVEYTKVFYLFSLFTLLLRVGFVYEDHNQSFMDFLTNLKSNSIYSEDIQNIRTRIIDLYALTLGYIDYVETPYIEGYLKGKNNLSSVHSYAGFFSHLGMSQNLPYEISLLYGSLREGMYNYNSFKANYGDGFYRVPNVTVTIKGYDMYSLGSYPFIVKGNGSIQAEVFILSKDCAKSIEGMELGAGYDKTPQSVSVLNTNISSYIYTKNTSGSKLVSDGDWVKYVKEKQLV